MSTRRRRHGGDVMFALAALLTLLGAGACGNEDPTPRTETVPVHWDLNAVPEPDVLRITGYIGSGSCAEFRDLLVDETDAAVVISVMVETVIEGACTADMRLQSFEVVLDAPLGERELSGCLPFEPEPGQPDEGCRRIMPAF